MKATVKDYLTVWPVVRMCDTCQLVRVWDKTTCVDCEAKGLKAEGNTIDVSYTKINHVVVKED